MARKKVLLHKRSIKKCASQEVQQGPSYVNQKLLEEFERGNRSIRLKNISSWAGLRWRRRQTKHFSPVRPRIRFSSLPTHLKRVCQRYMLNIVGFLRVRWFSPQGKLTGWVRDNQSLESKYRCCKNSEIVQVKGVISVIRDACLIISTCI